MRIYLQSDGSLLVPVRAESENTVGDSLVLAVKGTDFYNEWMAYCQDAALCDIVPTESRSANVRD